MGEESERKLRKSHGSLEFGAKRHHSVVNKGYIAWEERLLLANDGNFFRGYVYRRLMAGFFASRNADFLLSHARLLMVYRVFGEIPSLSLPEDPCGNS